MCGRFAVFFSPKIIVSQFGLDSTMEFPPRYNIAPTQPIMSIWNEAGNRKLKLARWGLVPHWVKDPREFPLLINARSETIAEKPAFRDSFKHQRCIVPASGYYEWHTDSKGKKQPHFISSENDTPLAMAGLYSTWMGPEGEEIDTLALITTPANNDVSHIHNRMPALLNEQDYQAWLDVRNAKPKDYAPLIRQAELGVLKSHPVSSRVSSAAIEGEDLVQKINLSSVAAQGSTKKNNSKDPKNAQFDLF